MKASIQGGNPELITVFACVCVDGSALQPSIILAVDDGAIQNIWVEAIHAGENSVNLSLSLFGWANNELRLVWLA